MGVFLFYGRAIDSTVLTALNTIAETQSKPTAQTMAHTLHLLDYLDTHPDATIEYKASGMHLWIDTDAAYLVAPRARSRVAGFYYLSDKPQTPTQSHPPLNGAIFIECKILKNTVSSAAESETGGVFHNCQNAIPFRRTLEELGHPQHATPIKTDNSTSAGFCNQTIKEKRSKSWDMRYHWIRDKIGDKTVTIYWAPGTQNLADYFTKHHSPIHHRRIRYKYLHDPVEAALNNMMTLLAETAPSA